MLISEPNDEESFELELSLLRVPPVEFAVAEPTRGSVAYLAVSTGYPRGTGADSSRESKQQLTSVKLDIIGG